MNRRRLRAVLPFAGAVVIVAAGAAVAGSLLVHQSGSLPGAAAIAWLHVDYGGSTTLRAGTVLAADGEVLTSHDAIRGAHSVTVEVPGAARAYRAFLVGVDPADDIAVLQLQDASGLATATVQADDRMRVGDHVTTIGGGTPRGPIVVQGSVSALRQTAVRADGAGPVSGGDLTSLIRYTTSGGAAPLSGGPLLDSSGVVVGVNVQVSPPSGGGAADAFALPAAAADSVARDIATGSPNPHVLSGPGVVLGVDVLDSGSPPGARVARVESLSPAQAAGITQDDVVIELGTAAISSALGLGRELQRHHAGDRVSVSWLTPAGERRSARVSLVTGTAP